MQRKFLFLQGPHGPFFSELAQQLTAAGAICHRIGFNRGDQAFWQDRKTYTPYLEAPDEWRTWLATFLRETPFSDLVLYGDTRPIHATAIALAKAQKMRIHVFEEGYLRPYWVSYERGGANGNSPLMDMPMSQIEAAVIGREPDLTDIPARWGQLWHHIYYGAVYHWYVLALNRAYRQFRPHRSLSVAGEFRLYLRRMTLAPFIYLHRHFATRRLQWQGRPYHLVLLQLEHDASFRDHGPFANQRTFLQEVMAGFAKGAPLHHHLVFKAHPLEDGRSPIPRILRDLAREYDLTGRVHFIDGGKLAALLDEACSALTVNSTAAQQALWRGLPLKAYGTAVYSKPEFVSNQDTASFFENPAKPNHASYLLFRQFLMESSQIRGSFYSAAGRAQLLRRMGDLMLSEADPYQKLLAPTKTPKH
ncbi:capsule biosynthesis protein CapA [Rhodobacterales bacterium HKCCA1288]|uniref:capsule biosynthesis protein n=1 Tax=Roseovarius sp. 10 TaxID=3080563 RepID=UPI0019357FFE|nr:capsule biosynthesis protein CapA [Roseovarius sp. 10]MDV7200920.1 capsule biosynthesis protein CapA [Roseovarius sp. 10]QPI85223.1 capsule biosynthesis protein CapA [Rhodobacterales bacterium HKCCA1288]